MSQSDPRGTMTIDELVENAIEHARKVLVGQKNAELLPTWLIEGRDRAVIVGTPFDGDLSKNFAAAAIRKLLKEEHATSYSFVSEAWIATEDPKHPTGLQPRDREDRREVVMVTAANRKQCKMKSWEIIRGDNGVITELRANAVAPDVDRFEGRLYNLFMG